MNEYRTGQIWALNATGEAPPLLIAIHSLDTLEGQDGAIAGVAVKPHPEAAAQGWPKVAHLPVHSASLGIGGARLVREGTAPTPDFRKGYEAWAEAFRKGAAGAFALSVAEAYLAVTKVVRDGNHGS